MREECRGRFGGALDGDLEINKLVCKGRHGVGEAEGIAARCLCSEDEVALSLFLAGKDWLVVGAYYIVVNVEGAARLDLDTVSPNAQSRVLNSRQVKRVVRAPALREVLAPTQVRSDLQQSRKRL